MVGTFIPVEGTVKKCCYECMAKSSNCSLTFSTFSDHRYLHYITIDVKHTTHNYTQVHTTHNIPCVQIFLLGSHWLCIRQQSLTPSFKIPRLFNPKIGLCFYINFLNIDCTPDCWLRHSSIKSNTEWYLDTKIFIHPWLFHKIICTCV